MDSCTILHFVLVFSVEWQACVLNNNFFIGNFHVLYQKCSFQKIQKTSLTQMPNTDL